MLDKMKVEKLYRNGYNAVEIAKILLSTKAAVQKCIQRNFNKFHSEHNIAKRTRKEALKAINYEGNKYMSDITFIKKNRSIYKTLENGDIVLNQEVSGVVSYDTPTRWTNEYKAAI